MEKLRVFEAFAGYGSQSVALDNIGVPHEVVAISEIDADVTISYGAIRGDITKPVKLSDEEIKEWLMSRNVGWDFQKQKSSIPRMKKDKLHKLYNACLLSNNLGDVSKINPTDIPDHDLFTYSFPCTDISVAGQMKGLEKGSGTRSGLLWECEKIIAAKKPKYLLMENVKNLVGKKFKAEFDTWCDWLETQGYKNFYQVLNAKDYGVPQNRERVFMISILDENATYEFPEKFPLELRLKDILEDVVDEKYYIDNEASNRLLKALEEKGYTKNMTGIANNPSSREFTDFKECSPTLCARDYKDPKVVQIEDKTVCEQRCDEGLRFFKGDVCGTIRTIEAGGDKRVIECGAIRGRYEEDG
ncbi:MAG: DNA (cytosine-5-)-methyltransferase, partial [Cellulosilyticaceae bacterium]